MFKSINFLIYTTSIFSEKTENSELFQFADDLCVLSWSKEYIDTTSNLQSAVSSLFKLITELDRNISLAKTKAIWFNPELNIYEPVVRISGVIVKFEKSVKYLGIYLDERLKFQKHIVELLKSIESRLNVNKMSAGSKWGGHPSTLLTVLKSVVRGKID